MATSRYVQITDWALLEYVYESVSINNTATKGLKIENVYNNTFQFMNGEIGKKLTNLTPINSVIPVNTIGNKWSEIISTTGTLFDDDIKVTKTDVTNDLTTNISYDTIKLHITSGFNLEGLDGFISEVQFVDREGNKFIAAAHKVLASNPNWEFNSEPIFLGDRLYDKYITFKVPSLSAINTEFFSNPTNPGSFGFIYTDNNIGFNREDALIKFSLHEINQTTITSGYQQYTTGNKFDATFLSEDNFSLLGARIRENSTGDYFEYFMTWDNGIPGNFINNLRSMGQDWAIIHQIEVFEQVTTERVRTSNMTILQDSNFDLPNIFRPVILNANIAFSFTINYVMRFFNKSNGQQIIRKSSLTSYNPKKYGRELTKITTQQGYRPINVFNKIVTKDGDNKANTLSFGNNASQLFKPAISEVFIPNYFSNTKIALSTIGKNDNQELDDVIWGQGEAIILLNEFDNLLRFKIYQKDSEDDEFIEKDLSTSNTYWLSFVTDADDKMYIPRNDNPEIDPASGEIEFIVKSQDSLKLLKQNRKTFYIISRAGNTEKETVIYQGTFENFKDREDVIAKLDSKRETELDRKIAKLEKLEEELKRQELDLEESISEEERLREENQRLREEIEVQRQSLQSRDIKIQTQRERIEAFDERERTISKGIKDLVSDELRKIREIAENNQLVNKAEQETKETINRLTEEAKKTDNKINQKIRIRELPGATNPLASSLKKIAPVNLKTVKPLIGKINLNR